MISHRRGADQGATQRWDVRQRGGLGAGRSFHRHHLGAFRTSGITPSEDAAGFLLVPARGENPSDLWARALWVRPATGYPSHFRSVPHPTPRRKCRRKPSVKCLRKHTFSCSPDFYRCFRRRSGFGAVWFLRGPVPIPYGGVCGFGAWSRRSQGGRTGAWPQKRQGEATGLSLPADRSAGRGSRRHGATG